MSIHDRFKLIRTSNSLNQKEFGEVFGRTQADISKIESGATKDIPNDIMLILNVRFKVNLNWLVSGDGLMEFLGDSSDEYLIEQVDIYKSLYEGSEKQIALLREQITKLQRLQEISVENKQLTKEEMRERLRNVPGQKEEDELQRKLHSNIGRTATPPEGADLRLKKKENKKPE